MKRRAFLKFLGLAPAVTQVSALDAFAAKAKALDIAVPDLLITKEVVAGDILNVGFMKELWPGIKTFYEKEYADYSAEYKDLFKDDNER